MDVGAALVILAVVCAVAWLVSEPLRRGGGEWESSEVADQVAELHARRDAKYREIRDAQLDLQTGKLSEEDHRSLDRQLRGEAADILRELDDAES